LSKFIGKKLRSEEQNNSEDLAALKEMLDDPTDSKNKDPKKKDVKKKDKNSNWHSIDSISIYDGVGLKGELELHFNALEVIKSEIDKIQKVKESVDSLVSKGLKKASVVRHGCQMNCLLISHLQIRRLTSPNFRINRSLTLRWSHYMKLKYNIKISRNMRKLQDLSILYNKFIFTRSQRVQRRSKLIDSPTINQSTLLLVVRHKK